MTAEQQCSICFELLSYDLTVTSCGHVFHKECVERWLSQVKSCPLCKTRSGAGDLVVMKYSPRANLEKYIASGRPSEALLSSELVVKLMLQRKLERLEGCKEVLKALRPEAQAAEEKVRGLRTEVDAIALQTATTERALKQAERDTLTPRDRLNALKAKKGEMEKNVVELRQQAVLVRLREILEGGQAPSTTELVDSLSEWLQRVEDEHGDSPAPYESIKPLVWLFQLDWLKQRLSKLQEEGRTEEQIHSKEMDELRAIAWRNRKDLKRIQGNIAKERTLLHSLHPFDASSSKRQKW